MQQYLCDRRAFAGLSRRNRAHLSITVCLEIAGVVVARSEDPSVANKALVVLEKQNAGSTVGRKDNV